MLGKQKIHVRLTGKLLLLKIINQSIGQIDIYDLMVPREEKSEDH